MFLVFLLLTAVVASTANATTIDVEIRLNEATALRDCDEDICRAACKRSEMPDGKCINGKCVCPITSSIESNVHTCNFNTCQNLCSQKGFVVAECYKGECYCVIG
jgi:hypothetical protein